MDSTDTQEKDVFSKMAKFNFRSPLKVTVIFDDDVNKNIKRKSPHLNSNRKRKTTFMKYGKDEEAMLNKVVLNMATIMKCCFNFIKLTTITNDAYLINLGKARLYDLKLHYFNESFIITKTLLLPKEKNTFFFDMVISKTTRILKEHPQNIYYKIKNLYNDLLDWTKRKIKKKQDVHIQNLYQKWGSSTSCHAPVTPPNIANGSDNTLTKNINSQNLNTLTVFSGGTPGNEITIDVDTRYLKNNYIDNVSAQYGTTSQREVQNLSLPSTSTSANNSSTGILNQPEKTQVGECFFQTISQQYINLESTNMNISPLNNNVSIVQSMQTDRQGHSRRSLSRDSGIISPDTFEALSEKNNSSICQRDYQPYGVVTPPAPNVSNGVNTALRLCFACGKATELVCLGCSKYYYCSTACQESQWEEHRRICHLIPKTNLILTNNLYNVI